jgi:hypothetical protein
MDGKNTDKIVDNTNNTNNAVFEKSPDQVNMTGGFNLFDFGGDNFTKAIKRTKSSENKLINTYVEMDKVVKDYHKSYDTHLQNLDKLDDYANFHGMENLFKKVIMKDNFRNGKVDKSNPLLFRNYLIEEETTPTAFRKEHILRQVNYVLEKYFAGREHMFIKHMTVDVGKHEFILTITTIENIKKSRKIEHNGYVISVSKTKKELKDILETTKKNLKRKSKLVEFSSRRSSDSSSSTKSTKKKSPTRSSKTKTRTRTRTRTRKTRTRTKSLNNLSIFNKSNNTNKNSGRGSSNNLPSSISIGTEKPKNSTKKEKLDIYLTPSQKAAKVAVQAIPQATAFGAPLPQPLPFAQQLGQPPALEQRKQELLGQPVMNFQAPVPTGTTPGIPNAPATNNSAIWQKCKSYQTPEACRADTNCFFSTNKNMCLKSNHPPGGFQKPAFGSFTPFGSPAPQAQFTPAPQAQFGPAPAPPPAFAASPTIQL